MTALQPLSLKLARSKRKRNMTMTERTVFMHDRSRCQIPVEFFDYYCDLGLLVRHGKNRKVARLRSDLKAKRDKVNGGLLFWVKQLEPIEKHSYGSNYQNVRR